MPWVGILLATSMLLQCLLLPQSQGHESFHLQPPGALFPPPSSACTIVRHDSLATRFLELVIVAAEQFTPHAWTANAVASLRLSQALTQCCCCVVLSDAFSLVLELANRGIDLDEKDNEGQTALHLAIDAASARERSGEMAPGFLVCSCQACQAGPI